jgi:PST family polysaccharide transporter
LSDPLAPEDVKRRAATGAAVLGLRGVVILLFGLGGNLALAALLAPSEFGLLALGNVLVFIGRSLSEGGLVAGFIARAAPPDRRDLEAGLGFQLAVTTGLAAAFTAGALPFGEDGAVLALMAWSVPLTSFRIPASLLLERELRYGAVATVEVIEAVAFYVVGVALVAAGLGVWGVALAAVLRSALGTAAMARLGPVGWVRPRWDVARIRPVLGFGLRVQQVGAVHLAREQSLSVGVAAIAGLGVLGIWTLAYRVLQVPQLFFGQLKRIAFPAVARLLETGEAARGVVERAVGLVAVGGALLVPPMVAAAPAFLPAVLGAEWDSVPAALAWGALGLMAGTPIATVAVGYLYATGDTRTALRCVVLRSVVWLAVALALVRPVGPEAVGVGWAVSGVVEACAFAMALRPIRARVLGAAAVPLALATAAGGAGWLVGTSAEPSVPLALAAALVAAAVAGVGLLALRRAELRDAVRLLSPSGAR